MVVSGRCPQPGANRRSSPEAPHQCYPALVTTSVSAVVDRPVATALA